HLRLSEMKQQIGEMGDKQAATGETLRQTLEGRLDVLRQENGAKLDEIRQTVDEKLQSTLDTFGKKREDAARSLREELTGNFDKTTRLLTDNMKGFGDSQHLRLSEMKQQINEMTDKQAASGENLRQTLETRLDVLRQENSAKLDEMRQTVDEKLQTTLEKRL